MTASPPVADKVFAHAGDIGDCISSLPTVRAMGGGFYLVFEKRNIDSVADRRESMRGARFEALKPLLEAQPYIRECAWSESMIDGCHDFSTFRHDFRPDENLADWQARHFSVEISHDPWLSCVRSPKSIGRTVVARSLRYQNRDFPWKSLISKHRNEILFVGLPEEHRSFQISNGAIVEYCPTTNLLELAEVINGADRFIGNQSCPFWIAAGLGVPLIQEVWPQGPNSIIKRKNARYLNRPPYNL